MKILFILFIFHVTILKLKIHANACMFAFWTSVFTTLELVSSYTFKTVFWLYNIIECVLGTCVEL